ncbi:hypothetical protein [Yinghuangia seranimata]|nr:hypothetical protein [Yinghuangia seranimata]MDI2127023.1 hypothetical protein [Yinghuangia seranimata]
MFGTGDTHETRTAVGFPLVARLHVDLGRCATALCSGAGVC